MKLLKITMLGIALQTSSTFAFPKAKPSVALGITHSEIRSLSSEFKASSNRISPFYGAYAEIEINGPSSLKIGGILAQKEVGISSATLSGNIDLTYLEIPISYVYTINDNWSVFGGLRTSLLLHQGSCYSNGVKCPGYDFNSYFLTSDFGASRNIYKNFSLEFSTSVGLTSIGKALYHDGSLYVSLSSSF